MKNEFLNNGSKPESVLNKLDEHDWKYCEKFRFYTCNKCGAELLLTNEYGNINRRDKSWKDLLFFRNSKLRTYPGKIYGCNENIIREIIE